MYHFPGCPLIAVQVLKSQGGLIVQKLRSDVRLVDNVPFARLARTDYRRLGAAVDVDAAGASFEKDLWQLFLILFNDDIEDDIAAGVPQHLHQQYYHRMRKDRLSRLWENMIRTKHAASIAQIESPEERAIAYLCSHRVDDACKTLVESGNPHLATLVSQIGRDATSRADMRAQVDSWRTHNVYSEMSEPIRALYELTAGNCLRSDGKPGGFPEDRASTFHLSERFSLDWMQAFGLRLWYGISDDETLENAVSLFHRDLSHGEEPAFPIASTAEDAELGRESPLWVVLKTYALATNKEQRQLEIGSVSLPQAVMPGASSESLIDNRLAFQLFHHLVLSVSSVNGEVHGLVIDQDRAHQLAWDYAWELTILGQFGPSLFVAMHLDDTKEREQAIKTLLSRAAGIIPAPTQADGNPSQLWNVLIDELQVPSSWLWVSKAMYAHARHDYAGEVDALIRAKRWNEAHDTFAHIVAPKTVIERDYATLEALLAGFGESPEKKIRGWSNGGGVYEDFLHLATAKEGRRNQTRLKRLVGALASLGEKVDKSPQSSLEERVAFREISRFIAGCCAREIGNVSRSICNLFFLDFFFVDMGN